MEEQILFQIVLSEFNVSKDQIRSKTKKSEIVLARRAFCLLAMQELKLVDIQIGRFVNRDRATVYQGNVAIQNDMQQNKLLASKIGRVRNLYLETVKNIGPVINFKQSFNFSLNAIIGYIESMGYEVKAVDT